MASGVKVADQVKTLYNEMKVLKSDADKRDRIRLVIFEIKDGFIDAEEIFKEKDLREVEDFYKFVLSKLDPNQCRYVLYDCHYETKDFVKKEVLVFMMWAPETSAIKQKMCYASSRHALKSTLTGIKHELQINDIGDLDKDIFAKKLANDVIKVEGHPVTGCK